jgi:hypothetical protein
MESFVCCGDFDEIIFGFIFLHYYFFVIFPDYLLIERYVIKFKNFFRISNLIHSGFFWQYDERSQFSAHKIISNFYIYSPILED